jgi:hypothetical protein
MDIADGYPKYFQEKYGKQLNNKTHCLKLTKAIYDLVLAARQWWKKFKEVLKVLGYWPIRADPCLFIRKEGIGNRSYLIIYVDDGGIFARPTEVKRILTELSKHFVVKDSGKMESFVGFKIIENIAKNTIYIYQPKLLNNLKE